MIPMMKIWIHVGSGHMMRIGIALRTKTYATVRNTKAASKYLSMHLEVGFMPPVGRTGA